MASRAYPDEYGLTKPAANAPTMSLDSSRGGMQSSKKATPKLTARSTRTTLNALSDIAGCTSGHRWTSRCTRCQNCKRSVAAAIFRGAARRVRTATIRSTDRAVWLSHTDITYRIRRGPAKPGRRLDPLVRSTHQVPPVRRSTEASSLPSSHCNPARCCWSWLHKKWTSPRSVTGP
jgi:hypothetical protein